MIIFIYAMKQLGVPIVSKSIKHKNTKCNDFVSRTVDLHV